MEIEGDQIQEQLTGRSALITGANRGLGLAMADRFASQNLTYLVLVDVSIDAIKSKIPMWEDHGTEVVPYICDVSNADQVGEVVDLVSSDFGGIDIVVNNAGIVRDAWLQSMDEEDWDSVIAVNLKGPFLVCRATVPYMIENSFGRIINITSRSYLGNPGQANYSASKAGLVGLTRTLSKELGQFNITANCIAPGVIETEGFASHPRSESIRDRALRDIPLRRLGKPRDVADVAVFLASDSASYVTGDVIHTTGGRYG